MTGLALLLSACTASTEPTAAASATPSPFADCAALAAAPPSAPATYTDSMAATLPDLELPCFTGGANVKVNQLRGPAVINLWGSWCGPCRTELPAMQQLADQAAGRLTVLGVNTHDGQDAAASFGADHQITMPTLYDRDQQLLSKLGHVNLPLTIFVNDSGAVHVEPLPLDPAKLDAAVKTWTGVAVTG